MIIIQASENLKMMKDMLFFLTLSLELVKICYASGTENDRLVSVIVIFRHGDRTPVRPYPNDPYKNVSFWPVDFGQLTNTGKRQHFALGQWLRKRYSTFLPEDYSETNIYIRSTDVDRTLMSAAVNLAGLYPPKTPQQIWNRNLLWQPIPIHTVPEKQDNVLSMKKLCPKYDLLVKQLLKRPEFVEINRRNHDLYAYLTRYSGELVNSFESLEYVYNTLMIEALYNFTLPNWTRAVFPAKMKPLAELSFAIACYTPELARLKSGPLFNEILGIFRLAINFSSSLSAIPPGPKFHIYSGHDTTIANVLNTLKVFSYHSPPYASTIIFELKSDSSGDFIIEAFYKNSTEPQALRLNCSHNPCRFEEFEKMLLPIAIKPKVWEAECENVFFGVAYTAGQRTALLGLIALLAIFAAFLAIAVVTVKCRGGRRNRPAYSRLPDSDDAVG